MTVTALLISLTLQAQSPERATLQYYQQEFVVRSHGSTDHVSVQRPEDKVPPFVAFRKNDAFAVWDERGLTVRKGPKAVSSKLPDFPTSPHAFSHDEIRKTIQRIRAGDYTRDASGLSGAKRIGKDVYFLVRWDDQAGKPWTEALIEVDLSSDEPEPHLLGRFDGLSMGSKSIDDKLQILHGRLVIVEHGERSWGLATYDPETQRFKTQAMGGTLLSYDVLNTTQGLFTEISAYGTHIAGRVDLETGTRKIFYEGREKVKFADALSPEIILAFSKGKTKIVNAETGAVRYLPVEAQARRIGKDVILYAPLGDPGVAWLMEPEAWTTLATWRSQK